MLKKSLALASAVALLSACGGGSGSSSSAATSAASLGANPNFRFDQTDYVGAFKTGATWASFALDGSLPTDSNFDRSTADGESSNFVPNVNHKPNFSGVTPASTCPSDFGGLSVVDAGTVTFNAGGADEIVFNKCTISGSVISDVTLGNDVVWSLSGRVNVGNGNAANAAGVSFTNADLTIEEGTVFLSEAGSSLVVTRGSRIFANGTEAKPVIMGGDDLSNNFGGTGEWGGLVLQGFAYNNKCGDPESETICNVPGEGDSGFFGGFNNEDNSGSLRYVIVTEAGSVLSNGDELNGIGFMGVGYNTTVEYIQVHGNVDDGVEFFGGAVDAKWLVLTANNDDSIDWDEGYVGNIQYGLILQTQNQGGGGNRAFELDTKGDAPESAFQESNPTVANVTAIASLTGQAYVDRDNGIHLKDGSEGQFFNMLLVGDYKDCVFIDDATVLSREADSDVANALVNVYCSTDNAVNFADGTDTRTTGAVLNSTTYEALNNDLSSNISLQAAPTIASEEVR